MRIAIDRVVLGLLAVAVLASAAQAQRRTFDRYSTRSSILASRQAEAGPVVVPTSVPLALSVQTTVAVPDGGEVSLGSYSSAAQTRSEYGPPGLGKLPFAGRGLRNVGYGRSFRSSRVSVRARIISLREEEERQTGFRSP